MAKLKQITKMRWDIKVGGKYYGDYMVLLKKINPKYTQKAKLKQIRTLIEEAIEVMTEQAVCSIQKIIVGKSEADLMLEEGKKDLGVKRL